MLCTILDHGYVNEKDQLQWQLEDSYIRIKANENGWELDQVYKGEKPLGRLTGCQLQ